MFEVGEYIVHPGQGVCRVESVGEGDDATYKLMPVGQRHPMLISFPAAQQDRLRRVLSADDARSLIAGYDEIQPDDYSDRSSALEEEHFKSVIKHGTCLDSVRVAKTFRRRIAQVRANNKRPPVAYERILKQAQECSLAELSIALDCSSEDVTRLLRANDSDSDL